MDTEKIFPLRIEEERLHSLKIQAIETYLSIIEKLNEERKKMDLPDEI